MCEPDLVKELFLSTVFEIVFASNGGYNDLKLRIS